MLFNDDNVSFLLLAAGVLVLLFTFHGWVFRHIQLLTGGSSPKAAPALTDEVQDSKGQMTSYDELTTMEKFKAVLFQPTTLIGEWGHGEEYEEDEKVGAALDGAWGGMFGEQATVSLLSHAVPHRHALPHTTNCGLQAVATHRPSHVLRHRALSDQMTQRCRYFYSLDVLRKILEAVVLMGLRNYPFTQVLLMSVISFGWMGFLIREVPYLYLGQSRSEILGSVLRFLTFLSSMLPFFGIIDSTLAATAMILLQMLQLLQNVALQMQPALKAVLGVLLCCLKGKKSLAGLLKEAGKAVQKKGLKLCMFKVPRELRGLPSVKGIIREAIVKLMTYFAGVCLDLEERYEAGRMQLPWHRCRISLPDGRIVQEPRMACLHRCFLSRCVMCASA